MARKLASRTRLLVSFSLIVRPLPTHTSADTHHAGHDRDISGRSCLAGARFDRRAVRHREADVPRRDAPGRVARGMVGAVNAFSITEGRV